MSTSKLLLALLLVLDCSISIREQKYTLSLWDVPGSLHNGRFRAAAVTGLVIYTAAVISLNKPWYKETSRKSAFLSSRFSGKQGSIPTR